MDKASRLQKILPNGRGVWVPIDHGASDFPVEGLTDTDHVIRSLVRAGVDVILAQKAWLAITIIFVKIRNKYGCSFFSVNTACRS